VSTASSYGEAVTITPGENGSLRRRLKARGIDRGLLLAAPAVIFVVLLFIYPFLYGLMLSFQPQHGDALASYRQFFSDSYLRATIWNTLRLALPVAALNVAGAMVVAYPLRKARRGRQVLSTAFIVPITFGTVLVSDGMLTYLGPSGWLNRVLQDIGLIHSPLILIHNYWGVFISLVITGFPFAFLLTLSHLTGIDPAFERAAASLGAGAWQRFRRVTLPLWAPGIGITFCLVFMLAFSVFPSAQLVGNPASTTHVLSIAAYFEAYERYDYSMACAITIVAALVELLIVGVVLTWRGRAYHGSSTVGKG
jgi:putative spermidine/putrescine transport system permease protein